MNTNRARNILHLQLGGLDNEYQEFGSLLYPDRFNLILFYSTRCLGCTGRALPFGYDISQEFPYVNLIVIHVDFGKERTSTEDINGVFTKGEAPFPIYIDEDHILYDHYACEGTPHWIISDAKGQVRHSIFGSQQGAKLKIDFALREFKKEFS